MRFMILRKADESTEAGELPSTELITAMGNYNQELLDAGVMRAGEGLKPSAEGARVKFSGGRPTVTDGPFAEAKELVAGFTIIEVGSREEALEWVERWPSIDGGGEVELELRPLYEAEDFGEELTPELRDQEERQRARAEAGADE
jgi:hypothetical protein